MKINKGYIDGASLAVYRFAFGLIMFIAVVRFFAHGWIDEFYIKPKHLFVFYGFEWVRPWPRWGMYIHFAFMGLAALGIAFGAFYRACAFAFFILFTYAHCLDQSHYLNHYYLISLLSFLMIIMPLHRVASFDAYRKQEWRHRLIPRWVLTVLRVQVGLVYVFAGIAKIQPDWLLHAQPLRYWLATYRDLPLIGPLCTQAWVAYLCSWFGAIFDLTIVFFLSVRSTRQWAYLFVVLFHVITYMLFPIGLFPIVMLLNATLFFEPDWPIRYTKRFILYLLEFTVWPSSFLSKIEAWKNSTIFIKDEERKSSSYSKRLCFGKGVLAFFTFYFIVQCTMPLRHWLYSGTMLWTEQGFNFSWNVMVMEKRGITDFYVEDRRSRMREKIKLLDYVTLYQQQMMSSQPDMIAQCAQWIRKEYEQRGWQNVAVYADVWVSLNGRPSARLVNPFMDLSRASWGLKPKPWLLPMPVEQ